MEGAISIFLCFCTPLVFSFVGVLGGFVGGKMSSHILEELDPNISKDIHKNIVKQTTLGFLVGSLVGGILIGMGLANAATAPFVSLSYHLQPLFMAIGFAVMGLIGLTVAGSKLFDKGLFEPVEQQIVEKTEWKLVKVIRAFLFSIVCILLIASLANIIPVYVDIMNPKAEGLPVSLLTTQMPPSSNTSNQMYIVDETIDVDQVVYSPDGKTIAVMNILNGVFFWDTDTWELTGKISPISGNIGAIAYSPDGKTLAISKYTVVELWDVETLQHLQTLKRDITNARGSQEIYSVAYSPDGLLLAEGNAAGQVVIWEGPSFLDFRIINTSIYGVPGYVKSVTFSQDGELVASGGGFKSEENRNGIIEIWNVKDDTLRLQFEDFFPKIWVYKVLFSPDGQLIAGSTESKVKIFDTTSGEQVYDFATGTGSVFDYDISPDGSVLAASSEHNVMVWDFLTGEFLRTVTGSEGSDVWSIAFSPDGKYLVVGTKLGLFVWPVELR